MSTSISAESHRLFDAVLERICVALQITETQFKDAEKKYESVCQWLSAPESPIARYSPHLYPQGSLKTDTTVRPLGQSEFDLDLVCQLDIQRQVDPGAVFKMIFDRLEAHGTYRKLIEPKRRCIRINYAGQFHLDVVPAIPDCVQGGSCIFVPDIPNPVLKDWKNSNPIGYAGWFDKMVVKQPRVRKFSAYESKSYDRLHGPKPAHLKKPLRLAVQLFKRWRDIEFADRLELAPPSILLTTLSGHFYDGEGEYAEALAGILNTIVLASRSQKLELYNPVNPEELLSERWRDSPDSYDAFVKAVSGFRDRWNDLIRSRGIHNISAELIKLFGEPVPQAIKEAYAPVSEARADNKLYIDPQTRNLVPSAAGATPIGVKVRENVFHGD